MNTFHPERWLILDAEVYRAIATEPSGEEGLLRLRLSSDLVEYAAPQALPTRLRQLSHLGASVIHLVVDEATAEAVQAIQRQADETLDLATHDVQLHDWYESPSDVLMALNAPDQAVIDALERSLESTGGVALTVPSDLPPEFHTRYRKALGEWEATARRVYGKAFDQRFEGAATGHPIDWDRVLPAVASWPERVAEVGHAAANLGRAAAGGIIRFLRPGETVANLAAAGALGAAGPRAASADETLDWTLRGDETGEPLATVSFSPPGQPGDAVIAFTHWSAPEVPASNVSVVFVEHGYALMVAGAGDWKHGPMARRSIEDPVGALWHLLAQLHAGGAQALLAVDAPPEGASRDE